MKILITGANGFIARNLIAYLIDQQLKKNKKLEKLEIIAIYRSSEKLSETSGVGALASLSEIKKKVDLIAECDVYLYQFDLINSDLTNSDCRDSLDSLDSVTSKHGSLDCIIHSAGLAHRDFKASKAETLYELNNVQVTKKLAQFAIRNQTKQFIFLSSTKVFGDDAKSENFQFSIQSKPNPSDAYGASKLKAELCLKNLLVSQSNQLNQSNQLMQTTQLTQYTILRLPLVYGNGARANFEKLWNAVNRFNWLPSGCLNSKRSMIGVLNLADLITQIIDQPKAFNQTFIPTDCKTLPLNELLGTVASMQNKPLQQIKVPKSLISILLKLLGQRKLNHRLLQDFQLKSYYGKLKWQPPFTFEQNFRDWKSDENELPQG